MDIHCRFCGEPWDNDTFHDVPGFTYKEAIAAFRSLGCKGIGEKCNEDTTAPEEYGMLADLLGDDPDGWAAMSEDVAFLSGR